MPLVMAIMALAMLTGLGTALVVATMTETALAAAHRRGLETFYAAEGAVEFAVRDLAARPDWDAVLDGAQTSAWADGPPGGVRRLGPTIIDLTRATADVNALLAARREPAATGATLFAYGRLDALLPRPGDAAPAYVGVWVAELVPSVAEIPPVRLLYVVGCAHGGGGTRRTVVATVARALAPDELSDVDVRSWEEPR